MRLLLVCSLASLAAGATIAAPLSTVGRVEVTISPELQKKAAADLGVKDVERLAVELRRDVTRELERTGVLAGGRMELVLTDVRPNRPTFRQLGNQLSLSYESFGVGGATIDGQAISVTGEVTPIHFRWYESDIREAWTKSTWSDANHAFDRFAYRYGRGKSYAAR
ncbi:MAG: hypothetical protein KA085_18875 [Phenylobacterium sp.]|uniref:hypothetical protein n=1 Tax=Phenylobacterium sp. TaxID=1871053 RepID=UPI001B5F048B|nr:hypothetical protein [Phenylobacterium sp.]MBP7651480.1 hypothetical protein [Phenylobacterium sp.]MBP7818187.1 hypothetical protein [Phenylobacterium sp.]MBP9232754.1 hypothetical protein [Phenylobacterium sp.]MBP9756684.1 hypothetical protein [Phenylobacterium sp.]